MDNSSLFSPLIEKKLLWQACEAKDYLFPTSDGGDQDRFGQERFLLEGLLSGSIVSGSIVSGSIVAGSTHEWFSKTNAKNESYIPPLSITALLLKQSLKNSQKYILWIGEEYWPTPYLLAKTDLLSRSLFVKAPDENLKLWAIDTALHSYGIGAVVACCKNMRFALSQRFALGAKQSEAIGIFFLPYKNRLMPSAATGRWLIKPIPSKGTSPMCEIELLKLKGSLPEKRNWVVSIEAVENVSKQDATNEKQKVSMCIPSKLADGAKLVERVSIAL